MYNLMKNLIVNKFYGAMEEAVKKLKVFFAINDLTQEQLVELVELAKEKYELVKSEEKPVEKPTEVKSTEIKPSETVTTEVKTNEVKPAETVNTNVENANQVEEVVKAEIVTQ